MALKLQKDEVSWFEQVSPGLLRNKAIRNYLAHYTAQEWPEVVKLTLLYGLINLHRQYPGKQLSVAQLREVISTGQVAITVESALPDVHNQLDKLQNQLDEITDDLYQPGAHAPAAVRASAPAGQGVQRASQAGGSDLSVTTVTAGDGLMSDRIPHQFGRQASQPLDMLQSLDRRSRSVERIPAAARMRRSSSPIKAPMAPHTWRDGDAARVWSPPGKKRSPGRDRCQLGELAPDHAVYPAWWGDGSDKPDPKPGRRQDNRPRKPPPRLAYSSTPELVPLFQDDLVTARYLDVLGSGYGPQHTQHSPHQHPHHPQHPQHPHHPHQGGPAPPPPGAHFPGAHPFAPAPYAPQHPAPYPHHQPYAAPPSVPGLTGAPGYPGVAPHQAPALQGPVYMMHPSGTMVPVMLPVHPQGGAVGGHEERTGKGRNARKKLNLNAVESRIKSQVALDKARAKEKTLARERAVHSALRSVVSPMRDTLLHPVPQLGTPEPPRPAAAAGHASQSPATPSDVADSLASNPWTSWFMGAPGNTGAAAAQAQQQQQQVAAAAAAQGGSFMFARGPAAQGAWQADEGAPFRDDFGSTWGEGEGWGAAGAYPPQHALQGGYPGPSVHAAAPQAGPQAVSNPWGPSTFQGGQATAPQGVYAMRPGGSPTRQPQNLLQRQQLGGSEGSWGVQQQQQQQFGWGPGRPQGMAWELGSGEIEVVKNQAAAAKALGARGPRQVPGVRPDVAKWAKAWVGDFGHLDRAPPRAEPPTPPSSEPSQAAQEPPQTASEAALRAQVDALRAQLQQARVSGSPESGLAPGGMSAGASAASAMAVPTAELKANLSTAAWALPPAMPPTLVAPSQGEAVRSAVEVGPAPLPATAASLATGSTAGAAGAGSAPSSSALLAHQALGHSSAAGGPVQAAGGGPASASTLLGAAIAELGTALLGWQDEDDADDEDEDSDDSFRGMAARVGASSVSSVMTEELLKRNIERMSNLMSDSEAGSEWGAWLEQGAPHAATESMGMAGAAPMALVGQAASNTDVERAFAPVARALYAMEASASAMAAATVSGHGIHHTVAAGGVDAEH